MVASNDTVAWDVSFWYWGKNVYHAPGLADGKFGASIKAINGGLECGPNAHNEESPKSRFRIYKNIFAAWNIVGKPDERNC